MSRRFEGKVIVVPTTVTSFGGLNVAANVIGDAHPQAAGHGGGAIANVTSLAGLLHVAESGAAYAAAKAGVVRLTKIAAVVYADRGIRLNCIAPGVTPTGAYYKAGPQMGQLIIDRLLPNQPIRRPIATSEQAAMLWLCSDAASMVSGHVLPVDGGWTARA